MWSRKITHIFIIFCYNFFLDAKINLTCNAQTKPQNFWVKSVKLSIFHDEMTLLLFKKHKNTSIYKKNLVFYAIYYCIKSKLKNIGVKDFMIWFEDWVEGCHVMTNLKALAYSLHSQPCISFHSKLHFT